jgi:hypothetical protein
MPISTLNHFFLALGLSYYAIAWQIGYSTLEAIPPIVVLLYLTVTAFYLASSVLMSGAIIARLLIVRRKHIKVMGKHLSLLAIERFTEGFTLSFLTGKSDVAGQYLGIAAVLIESYALDAVWGTGSFITFNLKYAPSLYLFNNCAIQVDVSTCHCFRGSP